MGYHKWPELPDNIDFSYVFKAHVYQHCKFLSNEDFLLLKSLLRPHKYSEKEILLFFNPIWIESIKGCWLRSDQNWDNYSVVLGTGAHRISYQLFNGPLIPGLEICHKCDRKGCCNPSHLFQGTHLENMKDAYRKGRLHKPWISGKMME